MPKVNSAANLLSPDDAFGAREEAGVPGGGQQSPHRKAPGRFKPRTYLLWGPCVLCVYKPPPAGSHNEHTHSRTLMQCRSVHPEAVGDIFQHLTLLSQCVQLCVCVCVRLVIFTFFLVGGREMRLHWLTGVTSAPPLTHSHTMLLLLSHFPMHILCGNYYGNSNLTLTCVGCGVSSADSVIVDLPLVCSSSAITPDENNIHICAFFTPCIVLHVETDESREIKMPWSFTVCQSDRLE